MLKTLLVFTSLAIFAITANAQTTSQLIPKKGLFVTTNKLTWITGSEINFLTPQRNNHHYYFTWWEQDEVWEQHGTTLQIGSENTAVSGTYAMLDTESSISTTINCKWNQDDSAVADIVYAKLWAPYFKDAVWRPLYGDTTTKIENFYGDRILVFTAFGNFAITASHNFKIKLQANHSPSKKDYNVRSQYILLYEDNVPVSKSSELKRNFIITSVGTDSLKSKTSISKTIELVKQEEVWNGTDKPNILLPQPKLIELSKEQHIIPNSKPVSVTPAVQQYRDILKLHWQIGNNYFPNIQTQQNNLLADEGYEIDIKEKIIIIQYKTPQGLQHAIHTLAQLTTNENGQLVIPQGSIKDEPSVAWRGIHMFTGPTSWQLHKRMYDRILFPLKMNKVVLQCEQAQWKSRPELHNSISVPLTHLKAEFDYLRKHYNEPIPLIQSLGHMEWFFKPQKNRFMAVNPEYPYTLNPDLPESQKAVKQLWDETFALLKPTTMHIGFDEIGMIGFNQPKEKEVTYFKTQINLLHNYAQQKNAKLMLWGDMGLGPGEGPDALNRHTKERAATIRSFIPAGSYVADWHYINNPNPEIYKTNLQIW